MGLEQYFVARLFILNTVVLCGKTVWVLSLVLSHLYNWKPVSRDTNSCLVSFSSKSLCKGKVEERYFRKAEKSEIFVAIINYPPPQLIARMTDFSKPIRWLSTTEFLLQLSSRTLHADVCRRHSSRGVLDNSVTWPEGVTLNSTAFAN